MGSEWVDKVVLIDPGVSLDKEDLELIKHIKKKVKEKADYVVFGGRPSAIKGLAEALIVFKLVTKYFPGLKLIITGEIPAETLLPAKRTCRKLGIEDKVMSTGFLPREKRFEIVARAKLMLYPSHEDAFPFAPLESLHLGTPVVGYRIPALELYYSQLPSVELVEEWDLEALTMKTIDLLEKRVEIVELPRIKSWEEIMFEEVGFLLKLVRT